MHPDVRSAVEAAIGQLGEIGASVEEISIPLVESAGAFSKAITDMEGAAVHYQGLRERADEYDYNTRVRLLTAILTPAQAYYKAQKLRTMIRREVLEKLEQVDVIVLPTSPAPAPLIADGPGIKSLEDAQSRIFGVRNFTGPFNLAGVPALSVPCGFTADGLPVGLQIVGRQNEDLGVLQLAHAFEQATGFWKQRP